MSFQSLEFFAMLMVLIPLLTLVNRWNRWVANGLLLVASIYSYGLGASLAVLVVGALVTYGVAYLLPKVTAEQRKPLFVVGLILVIAPLLVTKYAGFLTGGRFEVGLVPLGLSFFTFQQIWYLKEVYTGQWTAPINLLHYISAGLFFPTVVSGPILKPGALLPQLGDKTAFRPTSDDIAAGLVAIASGTAKKILLADPLAIVVSNGYTQAGKLTAVSALAVIMGFMLQLYFDFSGYSDVAIGAARLMGLKLPQNFNSPLRATSITQFWARWHMTLTAFLRECIYFPLGGNRRGTVITYRNMMLIFLISGLWHGAGWTFLIWGGVHGLLMVIERLLKLDKRPLPGIIGWGMTFVLVSMAFVYFRTPDVTTAHALLGDLRDWSAWLPATTLFNGLFANEQRILTTLLPNVAQWVPLLVGLALYVVSFGVILWPTNTAAIMERPKWYHALILGLALSLSILFFSGVTGFIYANF